jgi:hypothetical protein
MRCREVAMKPAVPAHGKKILIKDIGYFRRFHGKANLHVDLSGSGVTESAEKIKSALEDYFGK